MPQLGLRRAKPWSACKAPAPRPRSTIFLGFKMEKGWAWASLLCPHTDPGPKGPLACLQWVRRSHRAIPLSIYLFIPLRLQRDLPSISI